MADSSIIPFPYIGGKRKAASTIWEALGNPDGYIEPFCGSAAVLLMRPRPFGGNEYINEKDPLLVNFFRAAKFAPKTILETSIWPSNEVDIVARSRAANRALPGLQEKLIDDWRYHDAELAGIVLYGLQNFIGYGFAMTDQRARSLTMSGRATGTKRWAGKQEAVMEAITERLESVSITCGDFERSLSSAHFKYHRVTGVFMDPPYESARRKNYRTQKVSIQKRAEEWCRQNGQDERKRIVLAGYEGDYELPGWRCVIGKTRAGCFNGHEKPTRERLWLSPSCLPVDGEDEVEQRTLFDLAA